MTPFLRCIVASLLLWIPQTASAVEEINQLYLLQFNRWGELVNPGEVEFAVEELRSNRKIQRIFILSYGWANDGEQSAHAYRQILHDFSKNAPNPRPVEEVAVIAVGWDSSQTGFRKLFNDLLPLPFIADTLAFVPDSVLFPISFWSKAATADRIALGGLRDSLNLIFDAAYPGGDGHPDVYLIGHSFGTRIVSGLMLEELGNVDVRAEPFHSAGWVRGAILLQPAAVVSNLHENADYPVMVTASRHDHANGFLFPLANVPVNAFGFTASELFFRNSVIDRVESAVDTTMGGARKVVPIPEVETMQRESRPRFLLRRSLSEIVSIPFTAAITLVSVPVNYVYVQGRGLLTRPVDHMLDTLAQLPVLEAGVYGLDRLLDRDVHWGSRSKGLFQLGGLHDPAGRLIPERPPLFGRPKPPVVSPVQLESFEARGGCALPTCKGVFAVDSSSIVRHAMFGLDFENPWVDFTLGWFDPIGAHADYRNEGVGKLMSILLEGTEHEPGRVE